MSSCQAIVQVKSCGRDLDVNDAKSFLTFDSFAVLRDTSWKIVAQYERVFWLPFIDQVYAQALDPDDFKFCQAVPPYTPILPMLNFDGNSWVRKALMTFSLSL